MLRFCNCCDSGQEVEELKEVSTLPILVPDLKISQAPPAHVVGIRGKCWFCAGGTRCVGSSKLWLFLCGNPNEGTRVPDCLGLLVVSGCSPLIEEEEEEDEEESC